MKINLRPIALACLAVIAASCQQYSEVREKRPDYRYLPRTAVGDVIVKALDGKAKAPEAMLGGYLEAASLAASKLKASPGDRELQRDYNFAVARVFEVLKDGKLDPWDKPLHVEGFAGPWELGYSGSRVPERHPANFEILPADRFTFTGSYVGQRMQKAGLGSPLIVSSKLDLTKIDRFAQGKKVYYSVTGIITFDGRRATIRVHDPLAKESVVFEGHELPLAADFTASLGLALARLNPKKMEISRLLNPGKYAETARLARLQPYDPAKIPVICVHGLMDSQATWMPLINNLRNDPEIRKRYQFWFFSYPSGYPYPYSASILRDQMDEIFAAYPGHKKVVLIGHSMGGSISRSLVTDSGMHIWDSVFPDPPEKTRMSKEAKATLTKALIFKHRPEIARVIFISAPHRGADMASGALGRLGSKLVRSPITLLKIGSEALTDMTSDPTAMKINRMPNSVDTLSPNNRFVKAISALPIAPGIPYHSIMGDRGKGGNKDNTKPVSSDGIVPYWSSHLDGAQSELIVPSGHSAHQNPQAIAEVMRILRENAKTQR